MAYLTVYKITELSVLIKTFPSILGLVLYSFKETNKVLNVKLASIVVFTDHNPLTFLNSAEPKSAANAVGFVFAALQPGHLAY